MNEFECSVVERSTSRRGGLVVAIRRFEPASTLAVPRADRYCSCWISCRFRRRFIRELQVFCCSHLFLLARLPSRNRQASDTRLRARVQTAGRTDAALYAQPRRHRHGPLRRSLRRLLHLLLRRLAEEQSHSARPDLVERLRQALRRQSELPARHSGAGCHGQRPRRRHPEDRRLLRRLHGREPPSRSSAPSRLQPELDADPGAEERPRDRAAGCAPASRRRHDAVRAAAAAGPGQLRRHDRRRGPGRPRTSRSRLLHQGRRQIEGDPRSAICNMCRRCSSCWAIRPTTAKKEAADRDAHRDRPGQGFAHPRGAARSLQDHAQDEGGRAEDAGAQLRLERVFLPPARCRRSRS